MPIKRCCTIDRPCLSHMGDFAPDAQTIVAYDNRSGYPFTVSSRHVHCCVGGHAAMRGFIVSQEECGVFDVATEYSFCKHASRTLCRYLTLIETWPVPGRVYFDEHDLDTLHVWLENLSTDLLFDRLGYMKMLYVAKLPVYLEWYRLSALERQNQLRRGLLGPVVQLAARWGLGRDVCRLILNAAAPRLRR